MRREEQSGQDAGHQNAFGPQSGLEVGVSEVAPPVPSPVPTGEGTRFPERRVRALPEQLTGSVSDCLAVQEV
jgi:hypothetical protein